MNIKALLIEKERIEYIQGNVELATFLNMVLEHVLGLEEEINRKDAEIENHEVCIEQIKTRVKEALE